MFRDEGPLLLQENTSRVNQRRPDLFRSVCAKSHAAQEGWRKYLANFFAPLDINKKEEAAATVSSTIASPL